MRRCNGCRQLVDNFVGNVCPDCEGASVRRIGEKKEYGKQWCEANKEHLKEYSKEYKQANKEARKEYQKQWHQDNKEHIKEQMKEWYQDNPEYGKEYQKQRREASRQAVTYSIMCNVTDEIYFGSTNHFKTRICEHKRDLSLGIHCNRPLQTAYNLHGLDTFTYTVLKEFDTRDQAYEAESILIANHKNLFNILTQG